MQSPPDWSMEQKLPITPSTEQTPTDCEECILILDLKEIHMPRISLTNKVNLQDEIQQNGISECYYYQLNSKFKQLNFNLFEIFLGSKIGQQIAGISLVGNKHQVRSKINALLLPSFIISSHLPKPNTTDISNEKIASFLNQLDFDHKNHQQNIDNLKMIGRFKPILEK